jgi:serine/threonine protein kinase/CheY-like chemotaxis protein
MAKAQSRQEFLQNLRDGGLLRSEEVDKVLGTLPGSADGEAVADAFVTAGKLTSFQANAVRERRFDDLTIGHYRVLDRLGAGGMGTVYKALHPRMKRVVAIKVLSGAVGKSERHIQRFQREVEAVSRLSHPNIVMAHDADEGPAGPFLVMEFVDGRDLSSEVERGGPLAVADAVDCTLQAARALEYAHRQGIIHRDVKPANLLRDTAGTVKVADLGLARFNDSLPREPGDPSTLTQAGTIMGTVDYMSPEQALGLAKIDQRTDVYSLGCTLYYLLCGKPPYQGPTVMATLLMHRDAAIPSLSSARPGVPPALDQLFRRMVAKSPDERFGSLAEVIPGLEAIAPAAESPPAQTTTPTAGQAAVPTAGPLGGSTVEFHSPGKPAAAAGIVVLVEPSRSQVVIIRGYLQQLGFSEVVNASSGRQALEAVRGAAPRAVISALHLPDMTAAELAQLVAVACPLSPPRFVLITSQADAANASLPGRSANEVRLTKPFTPEQLAAALGMATRGAPNTPTGEYGGARLRLKVLLADDSAAARRHARGVLEGLGVGDVTEAVNGAEAVDLLEKGSYDLVVTDYTMPFLDGRGLVEFIRQRSSNPSVPVVVVTSETDPVKLAAVRQLGVSAIFDKRFQPEAVRAVLDGLR